MKKLLFLLVFVCVTNAFAAPGDLVTPSNLKLGTTSTNALAAKDAIAALASDPNTMASGTSFWLGSTFKDTDNRLWLVYSMNGQNWNFVSGTPWADPRGGSHVVHDPSWIEENGVFYFCYNDHGPLINWHTFGITSSTDLLHFTAPYAVDMTSGTTCLTGTNPVQQVFSPKFFRDTDNSIHIISAISSGTGYNITNMQFVEQHPTTTIAAGNWSNPVLLPGLHGGCYNPSLIKTANGYELYFQIDSVDDGAIQHAVAPTLTGTYIKDSTPFSFGQPFEGADVTVLSATSRMMFLDNFNDTNGNRKVHYTLLTDTTGVFNVSTTNPAALTPVTVQGGSMIRQGTYRPFTDVGTILKVLAASDSTPNFDAHNQLLVSNSNGIPATSGGFTPTYDSGSEVFRISGTAPVAALYWGDDTSFWSAFVNGSPKAAASWNIYNSSSGLTPFSMSSAGLLTLKDLTITGTSPFVQSGSSSAGGLTITKSGSNLALSGTPTTVSSGSGTITNSGTGNTTVASNGNFTLTIAGSGTFPQTVISYVAGSGIIINSGTISLTTPIAAGTNITVSSGTVSLAATPALTQINSGGILGIGHAAINDTNMPLQISSAGSNTEADIALNKNGGYEGLWGVYNAKALSAYNPYTGCVFRAVTDNIAVQMDSKGITTLWNQDGSVVLGGNISNNAGAGGYLVVTSSGSTFNGNVVHTGTTFLSATNSISVSGTTYTPVVVAGTTVWNHNP